MKCRMKDLLRKRFVSFKCPVAENETGCKRTA